MTLFCTCRAVGKKKYAETEGGTRPWHGASTSTMCSEAGPVEMEPQQKKTFDGGVCCWQVGILYLQCVLGYDRLQASGLCV